MAALSACSCHAPTECASAIPPVLLGSWSYSATQTSPPARLTGVLRITSQCGRQIGGTLDVTQADAGGSTHLVGAVSGTLVDTLVDFDAYLDATPRRHDAAVHADSLVRGQWVEQAGSGTLSGSFTGAWTSP